MYIATFNFQRSSYVYTYKYFLYLRMCVSVCHHSYFHFLGLIHSLMKQEWMIEQGFKWTLVETRQQRENSRVEHCFFHISFPSSVQTLERLDSACSLSSCQDNSCCKMPMLVQHQPH